MPAVNADLKAPLDELRHQSSVEGVVRADEIEGGTKAVALLQVGHRTDERLTLGALHIMCEHKRETCPGRPEIQMGGGLAPKAIQDVANHLELKLDIAIFDRPAKRPSGCLAAGVEPVEQRPC